MTDQISLLDLEKIDPPIDAARDSIDPDKVRELAESIRAEGLLQPILVRPYDGRFEVVIGHRRYLAHRLIGEVKIKSIVKELTDDEVFIIRSIENDQREDLNPIERAKNYKKLREKFNFSTHQIAQKVGKSHQTVMRYLKLLEVPEDFQDALIKGKISMEVALCLVKIEDPDFRKYYFKAAVDNGATLTVAEMWVSDYEKTRIGPGQGYEGGRGDLGEPQETLPIYQTCVCCTGPCDVNKVKYIPVCPSCEVEIRGALKPESK